MSYRQFYIIIFTAIYLSLSLISCESKFEPPKVNLDSKDIPNQESWNSIVTFTDSGRTKAVLKAGHISVYKDKYLTYIDSGAIVDFYKNDAVSSTLSGKRGIVIDSNKNIEVYDSVILVSKDGNTLKTDKLFWNNRTQRVRSESRVQITTPKENIEGIGFESDQNLKDYTIFKVTGVFGK